MLFEDRFEAGRLLASQLGITSPLDSVNLGGYCDPESGRRTGQWNDRPERPLRPQGPRSRHQIRRTPTTSSLPPAGTNLKSQGRAWAIRAFPRTRWLAQFPRLEDEFMCWFSTEYANQIEDAKAGQRLGIKKMDWHSNWVVRETDLDAPRPCPVCLIHRTRVLFRFSESQQAALHLSTEAEAVFRMLKKPTLDVFEFPDGTQITLGDLPAVLFFDFLDVPGYEHLTALLSLTRVVQYEA